MDRHPPELPGPGFDDGLAPADAGAARRPDISRNGETFLLPAAGLVFEDLERDLVRQALERTGGNQTRAARLLGMTRDQIRYRIRKFALGLPPESESAA